MSEELKTLPLSGVEYWREYEWGPSGDRTTYRIDMPKAVYFRTGGETHRVLAEDGVVHLVPAPGFHGCVLRWRPIGEPVTY